MTHCKIDTTTNPDTTRVKCYKHPQSLDTNWAEPGIADAPGQNSLTQKVTNKTFHTRFPFQFHFLPFCKIILSEDNPSAKVACKNLDFKRNFKFPQAFFPEAENPQLQLIKAAYIDFTVNFPQRVTTN